MTKLRIIVFAPLALILVLAYLWAIGALYYDGPSRVFAWFTLILVCWLIQSHSNEGDWQPDVAQLAHAEINGDVVTIHNARSFECRGENDYIENWSSRAVRLSQLTGVDMAVNYWGSPWMTHPIISFQFADAPPLCVSIETRKKKGQSYSAIGGLYRKFSLVYTVADETDVIRLRTNFRKGEDVCLYQLNITPEQTRERFIYYVKSINQLHDTPRWYNAITTNCTTAIRKQHNPSDITHFSTSIRAALSTHVSMTKL